jgi:hypothetical protein
VGAISWLLKLQSLRMGNWTPSIVPKDDDQNVYLVVNDFGQPGTAWCETEVEGTENVVTDLLDGQYRNPVRVVGFNVVEGWARRLGGHCRRNPVALRSATDVRARPSFRASLTATQIGTGSLRWALCERQANSLPAEEWG